MHRARQSDDVINAGSMMSLLLAAHSGRTDRHVEPTILTGDRVSRDADLQKRSSKVPQSTVSNANAQGQCMTSLCMSATNALNTSRKQALGHALHGTSSLAPLMR
uniref:Uncharacterized protein n=1 Tax=Anopheles albimanus TaxID=7167 RepID=A0A182FA65_ANOAL